MGLIARAKLVMNSKLSKAIDNAEDPAETLDYSYEQQLELLRTVKQGIADVVTATKRLQLQSEREAAVRQGQRLPHPEGSD